MDAATYSDLLREHRDRIYSRALYLLRDPDDAADVTQDVFLRLWRAGDEVSPERVAGWLSRVAHNRCIDAIRRRKVVNAHLDGSWGEAVDTLPAPARESDDPQWRLDLEHRQRMLLDAMAGLPAETRSVLLMHYFEGRKLHEIADVLGKSLAAVKVQIHRARRTLRDRLADAADPEPAARMEMG